MPYELIVKAMLTEPWAIKHEKLLAIADVVNRRQAGAGIDAAKFTGAQDKRIAEKHGNVIVIPVHGVVSQRMNMLAEFSGGTSTEQLSKQITEAMQNDAIKAIILDIDSPGGSVSGLPELAALIMGYRGQKPIIAQVNALAASAAYWIAASAEEVVITPSGEVGSIGVYTVHADWSKAMEAEGIKHTFIYAGKHKVEGNPYEPLGEEAHGAMQKRVDECYGMFVDAVAKGRGVTFKDVEARFGQGRVFGAKEAVSLGMADRVGTLADTLTRFGVGPYNNPDKRKAAPQRMRREAEFLGAGH